MPSPFPGLDPYLEGPVWTAFHHHLAQILAGRLTAKLRPHYAARVVGYALRLRDHPGDPIPHVYVELQATTDRSLVTVLHLLTPALKSEMGLRSYMSRRQMALRKFHLVELDLLLHGDRPYVRAVPADVPALVSITRTETHKPPEIRPIALDQPLPSLPIPITAPGRDVLLDLQEVYSTAYESLNPDERPDYSQAPPLPPPETWASWILERARSASVPPAVPPLEGANPLPD